MVISTGMLSACDYSMTKVKIYFRNKFATNKATSKYISNERLKIVYYRFNIHFEMNMSNQLANIFHRKFQTNDATSDQLIASLWKAPNSKSQNVFMTAARKLRYIWWALMKRKIYPSTIISNPWWAMMTRRIYPSTSV